MLRWTRPVAGAVVVLVSLLAARAAQAQSFGVELRNTMMPASGGMAGTSIARPQDNISSLNGNPGTLMQFQGTQTTFGGAFVGSTFDLNQTGNVPIAGITPFSGKSATPGSAVPNFAVTHELTELPVPATFGLGLVTTSGAGTDFRKFPQSSGTSSYLMVLNFAASGAVKLTERLSLGSTFYVGSGFLDGPFAGIGAMTNAYALRGTIGASYDLGQETTFGVYYQTRQRFNFNDAVILSLGGGAFDLARDVHVEMPKNVGLGLSNSSLMEGRLLLAVDVLFMNYANADLFENIYRNEWVLQTGAQYTLNPKTKLRVGYAFAENPINSSVGTSVAGIPLPDGVPAVNYLQAQLAIINQHRFSAGVGVANVLPGIDFDAFAGGMFPASQNLGPLTSVEVQSYWIGAGFTWRFCPIGA